MVNSQQVPSPQELPQNEFARRALRGFEGHAQDGVRRQAIPEPYGGARTLCASEELAQNVLASSSKPAEFVLLLGAAGNDRYASEEPGCR